eukprot:3273693-Amphidinium_carterae.1
MGHESSRDGTWCAAWRLGLFCRRSAAQSARCAFAQIAAVHESIATLAQGFHSHSGSNRFGSSGEFSKKLLKKFQWTWI